MTRLVGIGNTGCNLVEKLSQYPQYNVIKIDEGINVKRQKSPEAYEKSCPSFKKEFGKKKEDTFVFVTASGTISGLLLRVLEQLQGNTLHVVCLVSDPGLLSPVGRLQQNLVQGVLKEYARSGLLEKLVLIDNAKVENLLGDVPLNEYYDKLNDTIVYAFHSLMCLQHSKPILETKEQGDEISRITTIGLFDKNKNKNLFYDLEYPTQERYYYSFSQQDIKTNPKILQNIKKDLTKVEDLSITFAVYETNVTDPYAFLEVKTHFV